MTRAAANSIMHDLYETIGLDPTEIAYLIKIGLKSPNSIIQARQNDLITKSLVGENKLSLGSAMELKHLSWYCEYYHSTHSSFRGLGSLTQETFEDFDETRVTIPSRDSTGNSTSLSPIPSKTPQTENLGGLKIRIADFPSFTGKNVDWVKFYEKFTAVCKLQGMDSILQENKDHETLFKDDDVYRHKCEQLYSILKSCCASGLALPKVNAYKRTKDGHSAWQSMWKHYYTKGDVSMYAATCLHTFLGLELDTHSHGSADSYISKYVHKFTEMGWLIKRNSVFQMY